MERLSRRALEDRNVQNYLAAKAAFNASDLAACLSHYEINHHLRSQEGGRGREHIERFLTSLKCEWPDVHVAVERTVAQDDWVAAWCSATATHARPIWGVNPTHRKISAAFSEMHRFDEAGKICESWNLIDAAGIMQQLGLLATGRS